MEKKYIVRSINGLYFVKGYGFSGSKATASKLTSAELAAVNTAGYIGTNEVAVTSFAVNYVRPEDVANGQVKPNKFNPSKRRFATFDEAWQHGYLARTREESKAHLGFYVTETTDPVNASINWKTGLTNSI